MPYLVSHNNYERYDGSIEFNGTHYNYVKRKVSNDTLHLLCIPNQQKAALYTAKKDYALQVSDAASGEKNNATPVKKVAFFNEYSNESLQYYFALANTSTNQYAAANTAALADCFIELTGKPPQIIL